MGSSDAGADEWSNAMGGTEFGTSEDSCSTYRGDDDGSGTESDAGDRGLLLPPKKRPRGPGDLLLGRAHSVAASVGAGPSNYRCHYPRHDKRTRYIPAPGAMPSSFKAPPQAGFGTVRPYDNGLPRTDPQRPNNWGDDRGGANRSQDSERGDADDGSRKQGREFCEEILAKVRQQRDADLARQNQETPAELVMDANIQDALASIRKALWAPLHEEEVDTGELTAGDLIWEFTWLKEKFPELYRTYRVANKTRAILAPLVRPVLQRWLPLLDPTLWLEVAALLKNTMDDGSATSPYAALINDTVVPALQASEWKATDPDRMLRFLAPWKDMLPASTVQRILEEVVMPELTAYVDSWDPRCPWQTTCCHPVLLPWVPLAGPLLEGLYATVRRKLREGLQEWDAGCALASNYELVSPWKALFSPTSWELFVDGIGVVPRLAQALRELRITPPKQKDASFGRVIMKWAPLVRENDMVELLEAEFFGKWQDALTDWLFSAAPPPAGDEAMEWCRGWRRLFTPELLAHERVQARLKDGVDMVVSRAAEGQPIL